MMSIMTLLSTLTPISIMITLIVLAELSRRLGEVVKKGPLYRWFYCGAGFSFLSTIIRLLSLGYNAETFEEQDGNTLMAILYTGTLALGVLIGIVVAWGYWGWLIYASDGQIPVPPSKKHHR